VLDRRAEEMRRAPTDAEAVLVRLMQSRGLWEGWVFEHPFGGRYILDFHHVETGLVVELDGDHHRFGRRRDLDAVRDNFLHEHGLAVLRLPNDLVLYEPAAVLDEIARALAWQRGEGEIDPDSTDRLLQRGLI
jgi:very-short-patch-repair endonuclease